MKVKIDKDFLEELSAGLGERYGVRIEHEGKRRSFLVCSIPKSKHASDFYYGVDTRDVVFAMQWLLNGLKLAEERSLKSLFKSIERPDEEPS